MKRFLICIGLFSLVLATSLALGAQNTSSPEKGEHGATAVSTASPAGRSQGPSASRQRTREPEEGEDETLAYRHSASVRAIGRWLHLSPEAAARLFEVINFAILAGTILYFAAKRLPQGLRARRESIQKDLVDARTATEQANARLNAVEQKFAKLDEEIAAIRAQAERDGLAEEARIKALIETEKQRIVTSAEQEIAAAAASARRELKRLAGELAVDRAAQMISLTEDGDRLLVRKFSQSLNRESRNGERN